MLLWLRLNYVLTCCKTRVVEKTIDEKAQ